MQAVYHIVELYISIGACLFVLSEKRKRAHERFEKDIVHLQKKYGNARSLLIYGVYAVLVFLTFIAVYSVIYTEEFFNSRISNKKNDDFLKQFLN